MGNTGLEGTAPGAASGGGEAGLRPAEGVAVEGPSFEDLQKELEEIVARLERGDVAVDDAIALFRKGEELYKTCVARLQGAELRIEELAPPNPEA
jgi:exodeoxyribonuclease VII small subunit